MTHSLRYLAVATLLAGAVRAADDAASPIKVGEYASLTGKEAAFGQSSHKGTLLAVEEVNAAGGVLGRKLELLTEDNQSKQGESATIAKKLISRDKVVALLGEVASGRTLEAAPIAQHARIPLITPSSTNKSVTEKGNYIFRTCFIDPFQGGVMAKFARQHLKLQRVAVLSSVALPYSVDLAKYFREAFTAQGGTIAADLKFTEGDKDFKAQLTSIKAAGVDGIFVPGYYTEAALITRQARELGLTCPLFGGDGWEAPQLIEIGGAAMEGTYFSTHYSCENSSPAVQGFVKRFRVRFANETPDAMAALGYDSVMILVDALRRAGTTEPAKLRDALAATKNYDGITGRTTIDSHRNASKTAVVIAIQDGRFHFVESIAP